MIDVNVEKDQIIRMRYSQYKNSYPDCDTVQGSYLKSNKTIEVIVPAGRMKKSGTRGRSFRTFWFMVGSDEKSLFPQGFRAVDLEHAEKQARSCYKFVM